MNENLLRNVSKTIFNFSGLQILETQYSSLNLFLQKKSAEFNMTIEEFCENFCKDAENEIAKFLNSDAGANQNENSAISIAPRVSSAENKIKKGEEILSELINFITVNETYFFREEKQFDFLKNAVFPKYAGKKINVWSAACATGEEPLSILALAENCKIDATVFASDIDKLALRKFKEGKYTNNSFRKDGSKYHNLLQPFFKKDENFYYFDKTFIDKARVFQYNLISEKTPFPDFHEKMDVIFIRNVFIYFDVETRKKVLKFLTSQLKDDGVLLFSVNEVAGVDDYVIPDNFEKKSCQDVYYFRHKNCKDLLAGEKLSRKVDIPSTKKANSVRFQSAKEYLQKIKENKKEKSSEKLDGKKNQLKTRAPENSAANSNQKTENRQTLRANQKNDFAFVEQIFADVCDCINKNDFESAKKHVLKLKSDQKTYQFYMQGYIAYQNDEKAEAEKFFTAAETMDKNFWPAYFYRGLVLKDVGKEEKAAVCFKKCLEILDANQNSEYDFFIDSFSPSYIYSLCRKFQKE